MFEYRKYTNMLSQLHICIHINGGLANNDEYNEAYGFSKFAGVDAEGGNDNDAGKCRG